MLCAPQTVAESPMCKVRPMAAFMSAAVAHQCYVMLFVWGRSMQGPDAGWVGLKLKLGVVATWWLGQGGARCVAACA